MIARIGGGLCAASVIVAVWSITITGTNGVKAMGLAAALFMTSTVMLLVDAAIKGD